VNYLSSASTLTYHEVILLSITRIPELTGGNKLRSCPSSEYRIWQFRAAAYIKVAALVDLGAMSRIGYTFLVDKVTMHVNLFFLCG
jgi:hypothetical protein